MLNEDEPFFWDDTSLYCHLLGTDAANQHLISLSPLSLVRTCTPALCRAAADAIERSHDFTKRIEPKKKINIPDSVWILTPYNAIREILVTYYDIGDRHVTYAQKMWDHFVRSSGRAAFQQNQINMAQWTSLCMFIAHERNGIATGDTRAVTAGLWNKFRDNVCSHTGQRDVRCTVHRPPFFHYSTSTVELPTDSKCDPKICGIVPADAGEASRHYNGFGMNNGPLCQCEQVWPVMVFRNIASLRIRKLFSFDRASALRSLATGINGDGNLREWEVLHSQHHYRSAYGEHQLHEFSHTSYP